MTGPLNMGDHKVVSNYTPLHDGDLINKRYGDLNYITQSYFDFQYKIIFNNFDVVKRNLNLKADKRYVDTMYVKNRVGYVPMLVNDNLKKSVGFTVTASSEVANFLPYMVFNPMKQPWNVERGITQNFWIKIKCPNKVKVYKFSVRGKDTNIGRFYVWYLQGSNNETDWTKLYDADTRYIGNEIKFYYISSTEIKSYNYYRIFVENSEENAGLDHWQLYTLDPIYNYPPTGDDESDDE